MTPVETLGHGFRRGGPSPLEVTEAALDAIAADESRLNAVATLLREPALAAARQATGELAAGQDRGPLHGRLRCTTCSRWRTW